MLDFRIPSGGLEKTNAPEVALRCPYCKHQGVLVPFIVGDVKGGIPTGAPGSNGTVVTYGGVAALAGSVAG